MCSSSPWPPPLRVVGCLPRGTAEVLLEDRSDDNADEKSQSGVTHGHTMSDYAFRSISPSPGSPVSSARRR